MPERWASRCSIVTSSPMSGRSSPSTDARGRRRASAPSLDQATTVSAVKLFVPLARPNCVSIAFGMASRDGPGRRPPRSSTAAPDRRARRRRSPSGRQPRRPRPRALPSSRPYPAALRTRRAGGSRSRPPGARADPRCARPRCRRRRRARGAALGGFHDLRQDRDRQVRDVGAGRSTSRYLSGRFQARAQEAVAAVVRDRHRLGPPRRRAPRPPWRAAGSVHRPRPRSPGR